MKNPIIRILLAINALALCGLLIFNVQRHSHLQMRKQQEQANADAMVRKADQNDKTPAPEKARLRQISDQIQTNKSVTNDQLAFLLDEAIKPNASGEATVSDLTANISTAYLRRPLPQSQKALLYQKLVPVLAIPDATVSSGITLTQMHKTDACDLLARFDVREAVPQIVPLLDDPNPLVRNYAKAALKKLGYNT